ncbi:exocyst complex component EXO70B1 [Dendrobium catenatum]|uniref:exocyst complex component EXO70B1 n=1 Tax=Dendrobium catenatum TaxID=906689 RepID=UPI0010A06F4A|nr:exocyst complex component EXO70B1 [Dendrobium catenatum]
MELTQSLIPQNSISFSSSSAFTHREDTLRESDHSLSIDNLSIHNTDTDLSTAVSNENICIAGHAEQEDENAATNKESSNYADDDDLPSLSDDVDKFLSILSSLGDSPAIVPDLPDISIERFAALIEKEISKYESGSADDHHSPSFLNSVDRASKLTAALTPFSSDPHYLQALNHTSAVLHHAMSLLEDDFHSLLLSSPSSPTRLRSIATSMISSGYETECSQVFLISRRNALESSVYEQGFEKISIDEVQHTPWESLEHQIVSWTKSFRHALSILFPQERDLCNEVFQSHRAIADSIFHNLARGILIQLLDFAEAIAMTKRSAEKLFKVLDMYEALRDMIPKLEDLFVSPDSSDGNLTAEMSAVKRRLGEAVVAMFCDLESSIKGEIVKMPLIGGAVHPLTRHVMNYLKHACEYKNTLEQVFRDHRRMDRSTSGSFDEERGDGGPTGGSGGGSRNSNPLLRQLVKVTDLLHCNMEGKAKLYKDLALRSIFLMNNGRYIVQKIKGSKELNQLLGDTWCRKLSADLRQYHKNYQRETWSRVLACFKDEGLQSKGSVLKPVLKDRFRCFNTMFEEILKTQSAWIVSDYQLQSELRVSVSAVIVPAYRSFLARFSQYLDPGRQTEKYIKFGPEDLEALIDELFDGNPLSLLRKK